MFYIAIFVLGIKLYLSRFFASAAKGRYSNISGELYLYIALGIVFSVIQVLLFTPDEIKSYLGFSRSQVLVYYYVADTFCYAAGGFLLLSLCEIEDHRNWKVYILVAVLTAGGVYFALFGTGFVGELNPEKSSVSIKSNAYTFIPQVIAITIYLSVGISLINNYGRARSRQAQITNSYCIALFALFGINYIVGLWQATPLLMATRGIVFFIVVAYTLSDSDKFDIRQLLPGTRENGTSATIRQIYRHYANGKISYDEAVIRIEKQLVDYKLLKASDFEPNPQAMIRRGANSMGMSKGALKDVIKKTDLNLEAYIPEEPNRSFKQDEN